MNSIKEIEFFLEHSANLIFKTNKTFFIVFRTKAEFNKGIAWLKKSPEILSISEPVQIESRTWDYYLNSPSVKGYQYYATFKYGQYEFIYTIQGSAKDNELIAQAFINNKCQAVKPAYRFLWLAPSDRPSKIEKHIPKKLGE